MLDFSQHTDASGKTRPWVARLENALGGVEHQIAGHVSRGARPETIAFTPLKHGPRATSVLIETGGEKAVLKCFDIASPEAARGYDRERTAYRLFRAPEIVPPLLAFSDARRFVLTRHVAHLPIEDVAARDGALATTRAIGAFLARYEAAAPAKAATGNWYNYLKKFTDTLHQPIIEQARETLQEIPLCGLVLARDDPAMSNLLFGPGGAISGCDFERAAFRPRGWDFVRACEALIARDPARSRAHCEALAEGFRAQHRGILLTEELARVAKVMTAALAAARDSSAGGGDGD